MRREVPFPAGLCYVYLTCGFSQAGKFRLSPLPHRVHRSHPRLENGPSTARPFRLSLDCDCKHSHGPSVPRPVRRARLLNASTAKILQRACIATHASATSRIPSGTCCPGVWARGFSRCFARPFIRPPAACADPIAGDELFRAKLTRGFSLEPMTMSATSVLPSPSARHYQACAPRPRQEPCCKAFRTPPLSSDLLCPSALYRHVLPSGSLLSCLI